MRNPPERSRSPFERNRRPAWLVAALTMAIAGSFLLIAVPPSAGQASACSLSSGTPAICRAVEDTWITQANPDATNGGHGRLWVGFDQPGGRSHTRSFLRFDLRTLAGAQVGGARLRLLLKYGTFLGDDRQLLVRVHPVARAWSAQNTSWDRAPRYESAIAQRIVGLDVEQWVEWELPAALVQDWIVNPTTNFGIALTAPDNAVFARNFASANFEDLSFAPQLRIDYSLPPTVTPTPSPPPSATPSPTIDLRLALRAVTAVPTLDASGQWLDKRVSYAIELENRSARDLNDLSVSSDFPLNAELIRVQGTVTATREAGGRRWVDWHIAGLRAGQSAGPLGYTIRLLTPTLSPTQTPTPTHTPPPSPTPAHSDTPTVTPSPTASVTPSATETAGSTAEPDPSASPTLASPTATGTETAAATATQTASATPSATVPPTGTATETAPPTASTSPTPSWADGRDAMALRLGSGSGDRIGPARPGRTWWHLLFGRLGADQPPDPTPEASPTPTPLSLDDINSTLYEKPGRIALNAGQVFSAYGVVDAGLHTGGPGPVHGLIAEAGYGPLNQNPDRSLSGWVFVPARFQGTAGTFRHRYRSFLSLPLPGDYLLAFRFSPDHGATWLYADMSPDKKRFDLDQAARAGLSLSITACVGATSEEIRPGRRSSCTVVDPPTFVDRLTNILPLALRAGSIAD